MAGVSFLNKAARTIVENYSKVLTGNKESTPRWKTCVENVGFNSYKGNSFILVAGSIYIKRYFKPGNLLFNLLKEKVGT